MCKKCATAVKSAVKNGVPEQDAIDWLWEFTPFPVGDPTPSQLKQLSELGKSSTTPQSGSRGNK